MARAYSTKPNNISSSYPTSLSKTPQQSHHRPFKTRAVHLSQSAGISSLNRVDLTQIAAFFRLFPLPCEESGFFAIPDILLEFLFWWFILIPFELLSW